MTTKAELGTLEASGLIQVAAVQPCEIDTTGMPTRRAARSCAVRPALSKITTSGLKFSKHSMTAAE